MINIRKACKNLHIKKVSTKKQLIFRRLRGIFRDVIMPTDSRTQSNSPVRTPMRENSFS